MAKIFGNGFDFEGENNYRYYFYLYLQFNCYKLYKIVPCYYPCSSDY